MKKLILILSFLFIAKLSFAYTETFYVCNGGDGTLPETNACATAYDEGDFNTAGNWDTDDQDDGKIGPNDLVEFMSDGGNFDSTMTVQASGLSGKVITLKKQTGDTPTLASTGGAQLLLSGKSYVLIDGLTFTGGSNRQLYIVSGSYIEVTGCTFGEAVDYGNLHITTGSYLYIHDNIFNMGTPGREEGSESDSFGAATLTYSRIIDNVFTDGNGHAQINLASNSNYNVVRGNTLIVTGTPVTDADTVDTAIDTLRDCYYNLIEDNTIYETGVNPVDRTEGLKSYGSWYNIWRKNTVYNYDRYGWGCYNSDWWQGNEYNTIYNNTFYNTDTGANSPGAININAGSTVDAYAQNNFFKNNISSTSGIYSIYLNPAYSARVLDNLFDTNILYDPGTADIRRFSTSYTVAAAESAYPAEFTGNLTGAPAFTDAGSGDFTAAASNSLQVDAGTWLTTITSASGTVQTFTVGNAHYFTNGFGIPGETGDSIKTQNGYTGIITNVNYGTGQITVSVPIPTLNGEGISLAYNGNAPDIGAEEYGGTPPVPAENFSPADEATGIGLTTHLTFDYQSGETFDISADKVDCTTLVCDDDADGDCDPGTLDTSSTYYWKVHANTANQDFPETGCFEFTTVGPSATNMSMEVCPSGATCISIEACPAGATCLNIEP